jgi:signal transduction histidine kinase
MTGIEAIVSAHSRPDPMSRTTPVSRIVGAIIAACLAHATVGPVSGAQTERARAGRRVLVLSVLQRGFPAQRILEDAFRRELASRHGVAVSFDYEYFDPDRYDRVGYTAAFARYLAAKYSPEPPDLIFCISHWTQSFMAAYGDEIAPATPIVHAGWRVASGARYAGVRESIDLAGTVDLALRLQPDTREVVLVRGASGLDSNYVALARRTLAPVASRVRLTYLEPMPLPDIEQAVGALRRGTVVLYLAVTRDGDGAAFTAAEAAERVAGASSVPVYGWYETMIGTGIVGGRMYRPRDVAARAAGIAARLLAGDAASNIAAETVTPDRTIVDWRALRRWGIDPGRLPEGSEIRFREPSAWDRYPWYIVGTVAAFLLLSALLIALLVQRRKRRRAEMAARQSEVALRRSHQQVQDLAARLVRAQESERARIARELHDDVNQRLAGISIGLSSLCSAVSASGPAMRALIERLQRQTHELVTNVRVLSHQLHPGVLRHAGLVAGLRGLGAEATALHGIRVEVQAPPGLDVLSDDITLALYRITQEALQNAVRHASASQVRIELRTDGGEIVLNVRDDGSGFDASSSATGGLGLISIAERAQLLGGRHVIEAVPGAGTSITVRLPAPVELPPGERAREASPSENARELPPSERAREASPSENARELPPSERAREAPPSEKARELPPSEHARETPDSRPTAVQSVPAITRRRERAERPTAESSALRR